MSSEQTRAAVTAFFERVWNEGAVEYASEFLAPDFVSHNGFGIQVVGPQEYGQSVSGFRAAFPDHHTTIEEVIVEGDRVAVRGTDRGTHAGEFMGHPATGRQVVNTWIEIFRLQGGKAVEGWVEGDTKRFEEQLSQPVNG
ncbi:ester cyclase [Jatrophihabitans sp.]|jgi:predicted ester cyclase|uniref:ester cyclase n=1 Tax=Jatrophihabitans sp. TaxID=1932789 RepID=UPI002F1987E6